MQFEDFVYYDETSPTFLRWKEDRFTGKHYNVVTAAKDSVAGSSLRNINGKTYARLHLLGKTYFVHRVIWTLFNGAIPKGLCIDHINGDSMDNRISNIRVVSQKTNNQNKKKSKSNTSGVTGVCRMKIKSTEQSSRFIWAAIWKENGKDCHKEFAIRKYGEEVAFKMACEYRQKQIERLNAEGECYSESHGD